MPESPDAVVREIRSSDAFAERITELATRFHDKGYKNSRIPDIKADFQEQAEKAGLPEDAAEDVAGRLVDALMQEVKEQAPPPPPMPEDKWDRLNPCDGPLPKAREVEMPGPMYHLLDLIDAESSPFRQAHRLIDAIEWVVKWHTTLVLSDLLAQGDTPESIKLLLADNLRTPSLGTWNEFFRKAVAAFDDVEANPALLWKRFERLTGLENEHNLVNLRNKYAHGATPNDDECERDVEQFLPILRELVHSPLFTGIHLAVRSEDDSAPHVLRGPERTPVDIDVPPGHAAALLPDVAERRLVDLWPLGLARLSDADTGPVQKGEPQFFFFNALKHNEVDQLNYEGPLHYRDSSLYDPFLQRLPLRTWKQAARPDLDQVIEQVEALTDTFKGRREERARLRGFVANGEGTLMVFGAPGIGKSTLLAQVVKEVKAGVDANGHPLTGSNGTPIDPPPVIAYFIRRAEGSNDPVALLRSLCRQLDRRYGVQGIGMGTDSVTLQENLRARLQAIQDQADGTPERTVLLIDGLDEAPDLGRYIPAARGWLPVIVASRETPEAESFYESRHRETRSQMTVSPMGTTDVRAMLYDGVNKYNPGFTEAYVEAVTERSEGNPLYLKLLVEALFQGDMTVGDVSALPREMGTMYRAAVRRVTDEGTNQDAVDLLHLLAEAKAPLPPDALGELLGINSMRADAAVHATKELLREAPPETLYPTSEDAPAEAVQLFHESLREWMRSQHDRECAKMQTHLAEQTTRWGELQGETMRRYALRYGAEHQRAAERPGALWTLLSDATYRNAQVNTFKQYDAIYDAMQHGLDVYVARNGQAPEDDERLARLALTAGHIAQEAQTGVTQAFRWAEDGRMEDALQRIDVLDEEKYFLATLRLLWIEADRQRARPETERSPDQAEAALEALGKRIAPGIDAIDWSDFVSKDFMAWWTKRVVIVLPTLDVTGILQHTKSSTLSGFVTVLSERISGQATADIKKYNIAAENVRASVLHVIRLTTRVIENNSARVEALCALATALTEAGCDKQAQSAFDDARRASQAIDNDSARAEALHTIAAALSGTGRFEEAQRTAQDVGNASARIKSLCALATAMAQAGRDKQAQSAFEQAEAMLLAVQRNSARVETLSPLAKALAEAGCNEQAQSIFDQADATAQQDFAGALSALTTALTDIVLAEAKLDEGARSAFDQARNVACTIENDSTRDEALRTLASLLSEAKPNEQVRSALDEVRKAVQTIDSDSTRAHILCALASVMSEAGLAERAQFVFDEVRNAVQTIDNNHVQAQVLCALATALAESGHDEQAQSVFDEVRNVAWAIRDESACARALHDLSAALIETSRGRQVQSIVEGIYSSSHSPADSVRAGVLYAFTVALAEAGHFDKARSVAQDIEYDDSRAGALRALATALAEAGRFDEAQSAAQAIDNVSIHAGVPYALTAALAKAGHFD